MPIDDRKIKILEAIINDYINTGEPVGSRTLAKKYNLGVGSATIRNEMADLEDMGFLEQPHTSAGRVPSSKGYRLYVDKLMQSAHLSSDEEMQIKKYIIDSAMLEVDKIVKQASTLLSELTNLTCVVQTPSVRQSYIKSIQLLKVDEHNVVLVIVTDGGVIKNHRIKVEKSPSSNELQVINNIMNKRLNSLTIEEINLEVINNLKSDLKGFDDLFNAIVPALYETLKEEIELKKVKNQFKILESDEGKKELKIYIYMNNEKKVEFLRNVYIIKPYEKQFLDELSCIGIGTHYIEGYDDINNSFELLRNLGIKNIRNSIQWNQIENNKKYNFEKIDNWFEKIKSSGINILVILFDNTSKRLGNDYQISNENELKNFLEYANEVKKYYGNKIIGVEIWNEPNVKWFSNQAMNWYSLMVQKVNCLNFNNVVSGATATPYQTEKSEQYIQEIANNGAYVNSKAFSYHVYSSSENMKWLKKNL